MSHPLSNSYIFLCLHALLLSGPKSAEFRVRQMQVPACRTNMQFLCYPSFDKSRCKNLSALAKASKWALYLRFYCSYQVSGVSITSDDDEND